MGYIRYKYILKDPIADVNCLQSNMNRLTSDIFRKEIQIIRFAECPLRD